MGLDQKAKGLSGQEIDAIGEIMNISMGSAATAVSTMLDRQVIITTPRVEVQEFHNVSYAQLEPAIMVKIEYIEGISGSNVMVFRQSDMQIILNLLMGNEDAPDENFVFDELSMSAACEVMNQMMGSSATALSEFLGKSINISTPTATVLSDENTFTNAIQANDEDEIVSVAFNLNIQDIMNSEFISIMSIDLAKMIVSQVMAGQGDAPAEEPAAAPEPMAAPAPAAAPAVPQQAAQQPVMPQMPGYPPQEGAAYPGMPPQMPGYPPQYGAMPPYGYPPMPNMPAMPPQMPGYNVPGMPGAGGVLHPAEAVNVQNAQFPSFLNQTSPIFNTPLTQANMELVMNVPLSVTVEIGKTKRKIRDIMDFNQGTVIELDKQAGAPVDIVVNGQLIARGDVVVIDDNFGVRVTEIVGTKDLIDAVEHK